MSSPAMVRRVPSAPAVARIAAIPKSVRSALLPSSSHRTFPGRTSRCTKPLEWARANASDTDWRVSMACCTESRPSALRRSSMVRPFTNRITM
jgi:hypothetical protein